MSKSRRHLDHLVFEFRDLPYLMYILDDFDFLYTPSISEICSAFK